MSKQDAAFNQKVGGMINQALEAASLPVPMKKKTAITKVTARQLDFTDRMTFE